MPPEFHEKNEPGIEQAHPDSPTLENEKTSSSSHEEKAPEEEQRPAFDDKQIFTKKEKWIIVSMIGFFGIFR
jgi:hypothetical protein